MSQRAPTRVTDLPLFDTVIDARSPAEYALDHIPGAINCPVLDDDERRIVGTTLQADRARSRRGASAAQWSRPTSRSHLNERFAEQAGTAGSRWCTAGAAACAAVRWSPGCAWSAGTRMQLAGGYKSFRHHVLEQSCAAAIPQLAAAA